MFELTNLESIQVGMASPEEIAQAVEAYRYAAENGQIGARWKLARMARRAPSTSCSGSPACRSRSFRNSRMPLAKMRSVGPAERALRLAAS